MKPILFNTEMVRAIQNGTKTVTRRAVKPQPPATAYVAKIRYSWSWSWWEDSDSHEMKPTYRPGDILYVRETWGLYHQEPGFYVYKADKHAGTEFDGFKWRPSIHMPREAARIFLRVTDVRVERLQDITDDGIVRDFNFCAEALEIMNAQQKDVACMALWDSTIKPIDRARYGWDANPFVWVIEFERCEKPKEVS